MRISYKRLFLFNSFKRSEGNCVGQPNTYRKQKVETDNNKKNKIDYISEIFH